MPMEQVGRKEPLDRTRFRQLLRAWLNETSDETIGPVDGYGMKHWLHVRDGNRVFRLHADTKREGVQQYLELLDLVDSLEWTIVKNQRGNENAVAFGPDAMRIPGFYFYLDGEA